jgi:predicted dehydrogenase/nucleoside-diphosphate-sugar epimerase
MMNSEKVPETGETNPRRRVGLLGTGYIAEYHGKALRAAPGLELVAVCDRSLSRARSFSDAFGVNQVYASLDEMLATSKLDAVHVLLPPEAHYAAAVRILDAKIAVLLEKPMATSAADCISLQAKAAEMGVPLGIAHNFLFSEPYEQLRADLAANLLGPIDQVTITWHKPLGQITAGPFDLWMLREPTNILFEIGPHPFTHLLDLVGQPDSLNVTVSNTIELPSGVPFHRRWHIHALAGNTAVDANLSFAAGFSEHWLHVRGTTGSATVDFERNTYVRNLHAPHELDFDRYAMLREQSRTLTKQARQTIWNYLTSKVNKSARGNPYGYSIARAIEAFYANLPGELDKRISAKMGCDVIALCEKISALVPRKTTRAKAKAKPASRISQDKRPFPKVLVLGASGFIGKAMVNQLAKLGRPPRILVRNAGKLPASFALAEVDIAVGDCANSTELDAALSGIDCVVHLARANVKTWSDYQQQEIEMTRLVAERCLATGVKRFIYSGTIDSYYAGPKAGVITESTPLDPQIKSRNLYARAKAESEALLKDLHRTQSLPLMIFRPGIVIGSGGGPLHWGVGMWQHNSICQVWGDGQNLLPLVLVEDVVDGLIRGIDAPDRFLGEDFNLVADPCLSANDYLNELERAAGIRIQRFHTPIAKFYAMAMIKWAAKVMVRHPEHILPSYRDWASRTQKAVFDCSKAKRELGWNPQSSRAALIEKGIVVPVKEWFP